MKLVKLSILFLLFALGVSGVAGYFWLKNQTAGDLLVGFGKTLNVPVAEMSALQQALGFDEPKTYLLLFLNNTELRPGGGFIGAYGVVRVDKAMPEILIMEGSEKLDATATSFVANPPEPIVRWLKVKNWYFRDSNWSPDFSESARRALEIYQKENGTAADEIDAVIGFTPTVIEKLLEITGPISADGMEFNAQNFTEKLEYEVEYGFKDRGEQFGERKNLIADVADALITKTKGDVFVNWSKYFNLAQKMLNEKQVAVFAADENAQDILRRKNWAGEMLATSGDYLLWADANLGALKTDAAIERSLIYTITPTGTKYLARASMKYVHKGKYDWRTSRYLAYARVFVPVGSSLVRASGAYVRDSWGALPLGQGTENGKQWFGAYINIAPGTTDTLTFEYLLPEVVARQVAAKQYNLLVQKQIGTNDVGIGIDLNLPGGVLKENTNLNTDKEFSVKF